MKYLLPAVALVACKTRHEPAPRAHEPALAPVPRAELSRADFNRFAVRLNLPIYWIDDINRDGRVQPEEVARLRFYGSSDLELGELERQIAAAAKLPPPDDKRRRLVAQDLD